MKNQEQQPLSAKEQAIKNAYGEHWDKFQHFTDLNGWLTELNTSIHYGINEDGRTLSSYIEESDLEFHEVNNRLILKSLVGIGNNNSWFSIEEHGLPTENIQYEFGTLYLDGSFDKSNMTGSKDIVMLSGSTHYRPIEPIKPPHY